MYIYIFGCICKYAYEIGCVCNSVELCVGVLVCVCVRARARACVRVCDAQPVSVCVYI
jgi:hypothetical protein